MLHRAKKLKPFKQMLFTLLIGISVVSFWRGMGGLMNVYLFPNNLVLSYWASVIIGLFILGTTHYWTKELA